MKRNGILSTIVLMSCLMISSTAFAGGWGPFFQWSRESPSAGFPDFVQDLVVEALQDIGATQAQIDSAVAAMDATDFDFTLDHVSFGVLYDSAPSRDKLFNYRMSLGFDIATNLAVEGNNLNTAPFPASVLPVLGTLTGDVDDNSKYGLMWRNTFGFGILRNELLKWWAGPALNLGFDYWDTGGVEAAILSIGGGAETGVNIHVGSNFSVCLGGGVLWDAFGYAIGVDEVGSFVWGNGPFYFLQVAVLFHTGQDQSAWQQ